MKKVVMYVLTTLALIMTFGLSAYADAGHVLLHERNKAANAAAPKPAAGHAELRNDGHVV
jgi:hypothetical protein